MATLILVSGIQAQMETTVQNLVTLCNRRNGANCEWLETYKQQMILNDLLQKSAEGNRNQGYKFRHQVSPREAYYDGAKDSPPPILFGSGYKSQYNRMYSTIPGSAGKLQPRKPFNYDNKRARYAFSSWGGKRKSDETGDTVNAKREPSFSSWGGKRTQKFFNWGGKRSVPEGEMNEMVDENFEHNIMKRNVESGYNKIPDDREKRLCITDSMNLQDLFREFVEWSRKQPEQKKGSLYRKVLAVNTLHSPDNLSRRAGSFYPWGGKRGLKEN